MPLATSRPPRTLAESLRKPSATQMVRQPPATDVKVLDIPYALRDYSRELGARWDVTRKVSIWDRPEPVPAILEPFRSRLYSWDRYQEDLLNGREPTENPPKGNIVLRQHQEKMTVAISDAIDADYPGFLNADDVGLGKTIETWQAILETDWQTVLIVCPLSAVAHWRKTIEAMGDGGRRIVIVNYERLRKVVEAPAVISTKTKKGVTKTRKIRTLKGQARFGKAIGFDCVVVDESQRLINRDSARSLLAEKVFENAGFILWLSATAGQTPVQVGYLSRLLAARTGQKRSSFADFETWCKENGFGVSRGAFGKWLWVGDGKDLTPEQRDAADADLHRMGELLFGGEVPVGLRRSPSDIQGWPSVNRILLPVDLDPQDRSDYERAWSEFRDHLGLEATGRADTRNALVARLRFRQKASLLRTSATLDLAHNLLGQGQQVAISVAFHETSDIFGAALEKDRIPYVVINGTMTGDEREEARLRFQTGQAVVCLYTVEDVISLHEGEHNDAKRSNIVHDLRWSAIQMKQIEGRTHRDGKFSQVYWMLGADTVEEDLGNVVANRVRSMSMMQRDHDTVADIDKVLHRLAA